ncbi:PREDICTED: uncharacterized protein LOC108567023 [Nicrophorus vespilloides]|uniref:Uncharacterized protein LOC108567023 n=1 Tax=Nicrophorus vespilloides TaxID=110193 RepID=A0ABM1N796_NICVS|nr:PREDICTED: uncharacterized protein LOC108567023 [Nicrophorus vespilloides]
MKRNNNNNAKQKHDKPQSSEVPKVANRNRRGKQKSGQKMNEALMMCFEKICELQKELEGDITEEDYDDAQVAGYAACALETMSFLRAEGMSEEDPIMKVLKEKLLSN